MNLITDVFFLDNLKVIEESKVNGTMTIEGTFQKANTPNQNKRVYPKTVLSNQVGRLQDLIDARRLCGELDHPTNETIKLSNASHLVTKLWMEGNEVYGRAELLNTPAGKVAQTLISDGVSVGISSRGLGTLSEAANSEGHKTVNDDYKLVTFDLVADPSTEGAFPTIKESVEYVNSTSQKALKEKTYITLLKQEIGQRFGDTKMNEATAEEKDAITKSRGNTNRLTVKAARKEQQLAHTKYDEARIIEALEHTIKEFILQNEDHELAAQFIKDHKEEIINELASMLETTARQRIASDPTTKAARKQPGGVIKGRDDPAAYARGIARRASLGKGPITLTGGENTSRG